MHKLGCSFRKGEGFNSKKAMYLLLTVLFFACSSCYARDDNFLEFGLQSFYNYYNENVQAPLKSQETGVIVGATFGYYYLPKAWEVFEYLRIDIAYFPTYYDGTNQLGDPITDYTQNTFFLLEENLGYTFSPFQSQRYALTPYLGISYRYWNRLLGGSAPFSEEYSWFGVPFGLRMWASFKEWRISIDLSLKLLFNGDLDINLSAIDPLYDDQEVALGNGLAIRLRTRLEWEAKRKTSFSLTPWFEYSSIRGSSIFPVYYDNSLIGYGYEPPSNTLKIGLDACIRIRVY
jgi:hypothetical protein